MIHIVYKTVNKINGRFYIGKHSQHDEGFDGYLGSGIAIKRAIKKYGRDNFIRETLFVTDDELECYRKELELVGTHHESSHCYNMREGGEGFTTGNNPKTGKNRGIDNGMFGKKHSEASKQRMSEAHKGMSYNESAIAGTSWWNDGTRHKRSIETPGNQWVKGRINKGNLGGNRT
jgi:group I intron endonuclease